MLMIFFFLIRTSFVAAQSFASWTQHELRLNNGIVERTIQLPDGNGNFITSVYKPVQGDFNYFQSMNPDFQFEADHIIYSGKGNWVLENIVKHTDALQGDGAAVTLISVDKKLELTIQYLLYPGLPVIRKNLIIRNLSPQTVMLESVDVEKLDVSDVYSNYF